MIKTIKDLEPRPNHFGFVKETPLTHLYLLIALIIDMGA